MEPNRCRWLTTIDQITIFRHNNVTALNRLLKRDGKPAIRRLPTWQAVIPARRQFALSLFLAGRVGPWLYR
jgi:hypothetical protein